MDEGDLEVLREAVVKATAACEDRVLLDLIYKILISDSIQ